MIQKKKNINIVSNTAQQMKDKENEKLIQENKKLEKQKNDLYAAFKKSLKLCSILKNKKSIQKMQDFLLLQKKNLKI